MGSPMADARQSLRLQPAEGEHVQEDREALEHIARMLEGRVVRAPSSALSNLSTDPPERSEPLALNERAFKQLLEGMPAAIAVLEGPNLLHANAAFAYAFGYRSLDELLEAGGLSAIIPGAGESLGQSNADRIVSLDALTRGRRRVRAQLALSPLDEASGRMLLRLINPASAEAETSSPIEPQGVLKGSGATAPEPAEAEATEHDEAKAQEARRLGFLAKVSHEVRTPLNSILGFTELMLEERFGPIGNSRYRGYVEDIHQSGLYALSLLNDLLDISKIEAGKFELDFTAVEIAELVEDCVGSLQAVAKRERILLRTSLAPNLPSVLADRRRLKQILLNLLSNAIKFTSEGGQVIVSGTSVEQGTLRLRVHDTGVGMTADEIGLAMQPFHQLDTAPRKQTGTGLGLPLTKALVDAHHAKLQISSEKGAGTSADVLFPADRLVPSAEGL